MYDAQAQSWANKYRNLAGRVCNPNLSVLNLPVTMIKLVLGILCLLNLFRTGAAPVFQQPEVISPRPGDVLQGVVEIQGTISGEDVEKYDVAFAYDDDDSDSWFLIASGEGQVSQGVIAAWDTAAIADGTYRLKIQVFYREGNPDIHIINNLRVRNYTPIETRTPEPTREEQASPVLTATPMAATRTAVPLAQNPMEISQARFINSILSGAGIAGVILLLIGLRALVRNRQRGGR